MTGQRAVTGQVVDFTSSNPEVPYGVGEANNNIKIR